MVVNSSEFLQITKVKLDFIVINADLGFIKITDILSLIFKFVRHIIIIKAAMVKLVRLQTMNIHLYPLLERIHRKRKGLKGPIYIHCLLSLSKKYKKTIRFNLKI